MKDQVASTAGHSTIRQGSYPDLGPRVSERVFGQLPDGRSAIKITLALPTLEVELMNYGATMLSLACPDGNGTMENVTLAYDSFEPYLENGSYFGALIGRFANRIAHGRFQIGDQVYVLDKNAGPHHLHGGEAGLSRQLWHHECGQNETSTWVNFERSSPHLSAGYPGNVDFKVQFKLIMPNELEWRCWAKTTHATHINLTQHSYWNLAGKGSIHHHRLMIDGDQVLKADDQGIPTGAYMAVQDTALDFRQASTIGDQLDRLSSPERGFDHCYLLNHRASHTADIRLFEPLSRRLMQVWTTKPAVQLYSAWSLDGTAASGGHHAFAGLCLEPQFYPDSPNRADFPSTLIRPSDVYEHCTRYRFSVVNS